ncbi:MAG TPA: fibronectin type III domain-containing protein [Solirubrobacterales bacterium]|nr:fibronectin type III domain-containing protein [Solirubrobacterales bacterium]
MRRHAKAIAAIAALLLLTLAMGAMSATAAAPVVSIDSASSVSYTSAHLAGKVDPQDQDTTYYFQYSADPKGEGWSFGAFQGPLAAGSGETPVSDDLTGLRPGTEYLARLVAENADGQSVSKLNVAFTTDPVFAPAVSLSAPSAITPTSAHLEGEINPGGTDPAFGGSWRFECTPACPGLSGTFPAGTSGQTVEADATGLKPGTTYEVRLVAENAGGAGSAGPESFTATAVAPQVVSTTATAFAREATLKAALNPGGLETSYHFEYGPTSAYGYSTPAQSVPAGADPVQVQATVSGLAQASGYRFRLVATNAAGSVAGPDRGFTTQSPAAAEGCPNAAVRQAQGSTHLPECRAYEMVSPLAKGGADVLGMTQRSFTKGSADGNAIAYGSSSAFGDSTGAAFPSIYRALRGAGGWTTSAISPAQNASAYGGGAGFTSMVEAVSDDLSKAIALTNRSLAPGSTENVSNIYSRNLLTGSYGLLTPGGPSQADFVNPIPRFTWATPDFSSIVFDSEYALTPEAPVGPFPKTYVFDGGSVRLASFLPDGTPSGGISRNGTLGVYGDEGSQGAISADGTRVFFSIPDSASNNTRTGLYVRDLEAETTTEIAPLSDRTPLVAASEDGSKVLYTPSAPGYVLYDVATHTRELLTDDMTGAGPPGQLVALSVSSDLSSIYLFARGELLAGLGADGNFKAIYRWQPEQGRLTFVAEVKKDATMLGSLGAIYDSLPTRRDTAQTADGSSFVFTTDAELETSAGPVYDNSTTSTDCDTSVTTGPYEFRCPEVYVYEAGTGALTCISCPSGPAKAPGLLAGLATVAQTSSINQRSFGKARSISADGSKVFFESGEQLVPADTNSRADAYMWDRDEGLKLITTGTSQYDARILEASADGSDAFIVTRQRLVRGDVDDLADVYDVRVRGGFAEPGALAPPCRGEDCHGEPAAPPPASSPASSGLVAAGNHKQRVKKHTKKRKGKHKSKKHHKKKGAKKKSSGANRGTGR